MKSLVLIHPVLIGFFPILFLFSNNVGHLSWEQTIFPLELTMVMTAGIWFTLWLFFKNNHKAALTTSWFSLLFFSYGPVYDVLPASPSFLQNDVFILLIWILLLVAGGWWINSLNKGVWSLNCIANIMSLILVIPSIGLLTIQFWKEPSNASLPIPSIDQESGLKGMSSPSDMPDIYFIVLDAYAREDNLQEFFHFDNTNFLNFLRERDFFVDSEAMANYNQTWLALSSSLNLNYVQNLFSHPLRETTSRAPLRSLLHHNQVMTILKKLGYTTVCFQSGHSFTQWETADMLTPPGESYDEFLISWLATTALVGVFSVDDQIRGGQHSPYQAHRDRINYTLDHLPDFVSKEKPVFVFAHILAPHPPFVFGPSGNPIQPNRRYAIGDGSEFIKRGGDKEEYKKNYVGELQYINHKLKQTIDRILTTSRKPPVIILQSDHGSRMHLDWEELDKTNLKEAFSILSAVFLPPKFRTEPTVAMTPVNNFRMLFNLLFNTRFEILPNKSYYAPWDHPYRFQQVTQKLQ
jgi:hypothetical protein